MAALFIIFAFAMVMGTFIESWYSTETARIWIYNAWWFELIMLNHNYFHLSEIVLSVLLGTTTLNVLGLMYIVLKGYFNAYNRDM